MSRKKFWARAVVSLMAIFGIAAGITCIACGIFMLLMSFAGEHPVTLDMQRYAVLYTLLVTGAGIAIMFGTVDMVERWLDI